MSIKIKDQHLTLKLSQKDIRQLQEEKRIIYTLSFGAKPLLFTVIMEESMQLDSNHDGLRFSLTEAMLTELCALGTSKEGLVFQRGPLHIALQKDVRKGDIQCS